MRSPQNHKALRLDARKTSRLPDVAHWRPYRHPGQTRVICGVPTVKRTLYKEQRIPPTECGITKLFGFLMPRNDRQKTPRYIQVMKCSAKASKLFFAALRRSLRESRQRIAVFLVWARSDIQRFDLCKSDVKVDVSIVSPPEHSSMIAYPQDLVASPDGLPWNSPHPSLRIEHEPSACLPC